MKYSALLAALLVALLTFGCDEPADEPAQDDGEQAQQEEISDDEQEESAEYDEAPDDEEELAEDLAAGESGHYGAPFSIDDEPLALASAVSELEAKIEENGDDAKLEDIKLSGRIEHVCQNKGCWFTLDADDVELTVRIRMEDYAFFVPRNASGADAVIEGTIQRVTVDEKMARHLAEDQGIEDLDSIEGDQENYLIMARGISVTLPES
jgi:hypothetical protein